MPWEPFARTHLQVASTCFILRRAARQNSDEIPHEMHEY